MHENKGKLKFLESMRCALFGRVANQQKTKELWERSIHKKLAGPEMGSLKELGGPRCGGTLFARHGRIAPI
jgi:hypothetical protein